MPTSVTFGIGAIFGMLAMAIIEGLVQRRQSKSIERKTAPRVTQPTLDQAHRIDRAMHSEDLLPCDVEQR
jgi:hypothetical protein